MKHTRIIAISLLSALSLVACMPTDSGTGDGDASTSEKTLADVIFADTPQPNDVVSSPLTVTGQARGIWYFEASFPVRLLDANGNELAVAPAQAQGEWMTTDFVPFLVVLEFDPPSTPTGTLVLEKDNPSGLPEHAAHITVPVRFQN